MRFLRRLGIFLLVLAVAGVAARFLWWRHPTPLRHPTYALDATLPSGEALAREPAPLRAGAFAVDISPDSSKGAPPVWLAGFAPGRSALGQHDPIWARAFVLDDGRCRVGIVVCDLVGQHHDQVVRLREALPKELGLDYVALASTHNHEGPDTLGIWGRFPVVTSGIDPGYLAKVRDGAIDALRGAVKGLAPARLVCGEVDTTADELIRDSRPPQVIDARLLVLRAETFAAEGAPSRAIGTFVLWSNHPEALGDENRLVSSDFPHYVRVGVEAAGGGVCVFASGSVGGLMTPLEQAIRGLDGKVYKGDTYEKTQALGEVLATRAMEALASPHVLRLERPRIAVRAKVIDVEASNPIFWAGMKLGALDRGMSLSADGRALVRTEVAAIRVGPVSLALVPGELYPEIALGKIESPEGADFPGSPLEVPPLRALLLEGGGATDLAGIVGLANDEVGYLVPHTQWDAAAPYTYGQKEAPYGEVNSLGPEAARTVHAALAETIRGLPR